MSLPGTNVELEFINVAEGVPINVGIQTYDVGHVYVLYGTGDIAAQVGLDYDILLDADFGFFTITPLLGLMDKIATDGTNIVHIGRSVPLTSDFDNDDAFVRTKLVTEFDKVWMAIQQLNFGGVVDTGGGAVSDPLKANVNSPILTGTPQAPTAAAATNTTQIATTAFVQTAVSIVVGGGGDPLKANIASPTFTGNPAAPTPTFGDNDTSIATTAFVQAAIAAVLGGVSAAFDTLAEIAAALALKANIASPALTGVPTAPTAAPGVNTTQLATTAFVTAAVAAGGGGGAAITSAKPITLSRLPLNGSGRYKWNAASHIQDNLFSGTIDGVEYQFALIVEALTLNPCIMRRTLPHGAWGAPVDLSGNFGTAGLDSHNVFCGALDRDGFIHVMGNMHDDNLLYARSDNPGDGAISFTSIDTMTGANENEVSYPCLFSMTNGELLCSWRNGVSGEGNEYLNRYNEATTSWIVVKAPLVDGLVSNESAYFNHRVVDANDRLHIAFMWRDTGGPLTNNDLSYAYSDDHGATWKKAGGAAQTVPITRANCDIIENTTDGSGLLNQCGMCADILGRPFIAGFLFDGGSGSQINLWWFDLTTWHKEQITNFSKGLTFGSSTTNGEVMRPFVFSTPANKVYIGFAHKFTHRAGSVRCIEVTPGTSPRPEFSIMDLDMWEGEVTYDSHALRTRGELSFIWQPAMNYPWDLVPPVSPTPPFDENMWSNFVPIVATYDLDLFDMVQAGLVPLPCVDMMISTGYGTNAQNFTTTTPAGTNVKIPLARDIIENGIPFVRHQARGLVTAGSAIMQLNITETNEEGTASDVIYGAMNWVGTTRKFKGSPWMPVRIVPNYADEERIGYLNGQVFMSANGSTGQINAHTMQLGVIRLPEG